MTILEAIKSGPKTFRELRDLTQLPPRLLRREIDRLAAEGQIEATWANTPGTPYLVFRLVQVQGATEPVGFFRLWQ